MAAIVVAAGRGERASVSGDGVPKQYRLLAGRPVLAHSVAAMLAVPGLERLVVVIGEDQGALYEALDLADARILPPVIGSTTRQGSVRAGLEALAIYRPAFVLIHDAARPLVAPEVTAAVLGGLLENDGAIPATPVTDTLKRAPDGRTIVATEDRGTLFAAQTPQGFRFPQILSAHLRAQNLPRPLTDDAAVAEWAGLRVTLVAGSATNLKITTPDDFGRAERLLLGDAPMMETRVGSGFDVHPFAPGDAVWLGGVRIPHTAMLAGHSDADVGLHALTDAVLGAIGEGDIGTHFPPSDPQWRGAPSRLFLEHAATLVTQRGGRIVNLDLTLVCEEPRIGPHVAAMRSTIAEACGINAGRVAVKATTSERLGFTGRKEGIVAMASASVEVPRE